MQTLKRSIVTGVEMNGQVVTSSSPQNSCGKQYPLSEKSFEYALGIQLDSGEILRLPMPRDMAEQLGTGLGRRIKITVQLEDLRF